MRRIFLAGLCLWSGLLFAEESAKPTPEGLEFFEKKIRPVLTQQCYNCHSVGGKGVKGGLRLDTREGLLKGGESGKVVVPGNSDESLLMEALRHEGLEMPPSGKLSEEVIADFAKWIDMGAPDPRDGATPGYVHREINFEEARKFWAWQAPKKSPAPNTKDTSWPRTDIDRFVLAKLEEQRLHPNTDADKATLLRRVTFDLIGLPPTPEETAAFQRDTSPNAFEKVVDQLLASPRFGERWGRHWLDVARYGESTGKERNVPYPQAWRYRDYVIDSFNADKPYDLFIREQIAGDLMASKSLEEKNVRMVATGFLALGPKGLNEKNAEQYLMDEVDEQLDTATRAVLATTVGCARCHDHKFDPIPTTDYYALAGIFRSTNTLSGVKRGQKQFDNSLLLTLAPLPLSGDSKPLQGKLDQLASLEKELAEKQAEFERAQKQVKRTKKLAENGDKKKKRQAALENTPRPQQVRKEVNALEARVAAISKELPDRGVTMGVREGRASDCEICIRGEPDDRGPSVPRGFLTITKSSQDPKLDLAHSGRLELAEWLTARHNPLPARVMVNRVWQHLFGTGIVETVDNFGQLSERPTHPELLDTLAVEFMNDGWSVKRLIRKIVLSRTYQQSSDHNEAGMAADPASRFLWRMPRRRLDAEAIRDATLAISGQLNLRRPTGSAVQDLGNGEIGRGISPKSLHANATYRSVYLPILRGVIPEMLSVFDLADPNLVVGQREVTTVATQALYMMNSPFILEQSDKFATRLQEQRSLTELERLKLAYQLALGRTPTAEELRASMEFLHARKPSGKKPVPGKPDPLPWAELCQTLLASAEFRYVY